MCNATTKTITITNAQAEVIGDMLHNIIETEIDNVRSSIDQGFYEQAKEAATALNELIGIMAQMYKG